MSELAYWLLLLKAPKLGIKTFDKVLNFFDSAQAVFLATDGQRRQSALFKKQTLDWLSQATEQLISADLDWQQQANHHIITQMDDDYPAQLKATADPPPLLYVHGDLSILKTPQIAIVGSRNPTPSGLEYTQDFSEQLSHLGLTITSGLATGIDAGAHIGALNTSQKTIAVCGTGLDRVYPSRHKNLARQIASSGALVSELMIGTPAIANNFPKRNRIISGLALGVLVVEAQFKSGSLITARMAVEEGREVFAMPSSIYNTNANGCHQLIKQGANLVDSVDDIIGHIHFKPTKTLQSDNIVPTKTKNQHKVGNILLKYLSYKPSTVDELTQRSNLDITQVNQLLLSLELTGKIYHIPNSGFVLR